mgnify:CR=1 FL=1
MKRRGRIAIMVGTGVIVSGLLIVSFVNFFYRSDAVTGSIITQEVRRLADIFHKIDKQCKILGFDNQQNIINFLNVGTFTGSEVGPMNLGRPEKWEGPYVDDNPTIQSKEFMVVVTDKGTFITPGNGVRLANGKVIGKDIVLSKDADIFAMAQDPELLQYKGRACAQKLNLTTKVPSPALEELAHIEG